MKITGIICEYNPLHLGHKKQLDHIRAVNGPESAIVCLMSGNFVQRGHPAIVDKLTRAKAALLCGADLVLELPITASLSSAEGFAAGGVRILSPFCNELCFGAETAQSDLLMDTAKQLLSPSFSQLLHKELDKGVSFPVARQAALEAAGMNGGILASPNNILGVEYCKAILSQNASMKILPIHRHGNYHNTTADKSNPSATAVRTLMLGGEHWQSYIPAEIHSLFQNATLHTISAGERAILARLRCMTPTDFEALPYGSEGLWRKLMHAVHREATLEGILQAIKSKRYTRTRLDRMILCAYLGITRDMLWEQPPYVRVLALNSRGREVLKTARSTGAFINIGQACDHAYQLFENRCGDLYGLFSTDIPDAPGAESAYRVYCQE